MEGEIGSDLVITMIIAKVTARFARTRTVPLADTRNVDQLICPGIQVPKTSKHLLLEFPPLPPLQPWLSILPLPVVESCPECRDMESSTSQDVHGGTAIVQQYLQDVDPLGTGMEGQSHLTLLSSQCILLFQIILKALRAKRSSASAERQFLDISLERSYERLKIWSDENGMADGNLDAKLEESRDLQRDTLKYVVSIGQALTDRLVNILDADLGDAGYKSISVLRSLTAAVMEGDSDSSSDSGFSDASVVSINGVLEDLRVDTTCLLDLEPLFFSPISRTKTEPIVVLDTTRIKWSPHQPYSDKVSARFPMAADELVARLGKANYERYLRCQEQKYTNELGVMPSGQTASSVPDGASSKFHDSGIGSSLPTTGSAYAETVMSYGADEGRRVRVPPLPDEAKKGLPFACVVCGKCVTITTNSAWKQHVYGDLEPWTCLEAGCTSATKTFPTRNDWISHLFLNHGMGPGWHMIQCPLCRDDVGPGKVPITRHLSDHLEEISLSALPVDCEFDDDHEDCEFDDDHEDCEFDDDHEDSEHDGEGKNIETVERASDLQNIFRKRITPLEEAHHEPPEQASSEREIELMKRLRKLEGIVEQLSGQIEVQAASNHSSSDNAPGAIAENKGKVSNGPPGAADEPVMPNLVGDQQELKPGQTDRETVADCVTAPSSYWSVAEMNKFPELLQSFGTDWKAIAEHLGTKTPKMVKYFYNNQISRERPEWGDIATEADQKVQRGKKLPVPPEPAGGRSVQKPPQQPYYISSRLSSLPMDNKNQLEAYSGQAFQHPPPTQSSMLRRLNAQSLSDPNSGTMEVPSSQDTQHVHATVPSVATAFTASHIAPSQQYSSAHVETLVPPAMWQASVAGIYAGVPNTDREVDAALESNRLPTKTQTKIKEDDSEGELMDDNRKLPDEHNQTALGTGISTSSNNGVQKSPGLTHSRGGVSMSKANASSRARRHRREYPSSWGFEKGQMSTKKRVLSVVDEGPRRLAKDGMMLSTERELDDGRSYVTDLDAQPIKRGEGFLNAAEEDTGIWVSDEQTEEDLKAVLEAQSQ
ncbi:hypothetical protein KVR01_013575 [Diaporthe batatas]|uniref:uncharacterized protein n=1 Tax=Diaporthe batatas TaxID=748121 RepID=UPI001D053219|nr:uncharacterized protein KVR01_013575 [Diaporthe batatas]KAG8156624.1 hypothetical protein KVR01_013575 [Diaporthe batatas]